jgi:tRNA dimethylallyltransferase
MWEKGFINEVETLLKSPIGRTAKQAIGYAQIINYLNGETSEDDAKELTKIATRQYARRQETWFKRDERITWVAAGSNRKEVVLQDILKA